MFKTGQKITIIINNIAMGNEKSKPIKILCIISFAVVVITSIPLFVTYLKGTSPKYPFITDLHVWFGVIFIIFALLRLVRTKLREHAGKSVNKQEGYEK